MTYYSSDPRRSKSEKEMLSISSRLRKIRLRRASATEMILLKQAEFIMTQPIPMKQRNTQSNSRVTALPPRTFPPCPRHTSLPSTHTRSTDLLIELHQKILSSEMMQNHPDLVKMLLDCYGFYVRSSVYINEHQNRDITQNHMSACAHRTNVCHTSAVPKTHGRVRLCTACPAAHCFVQP